MTTRADALAQRFEQANAQVRQLLSDCTDEQSQVFCPAERCTAVSLACHIAAVHSVVVDWTRLIVDGESLPQLTMADIDRANEARFAIDASCTWDVAVERLQRNGEAASAYVRTLSDEDLDRAATFTLFGGARVSAQTVIEQILIGDPLAHVASLREALHTGASTSDAAAS